MILRDFANRAAQDPIRPATLKHYPDTLLAEWGTRMFSLGQIVLGNIAEVKYGGRLVVLDDGSRWEVDEFDDDIADLWLPPERVVVIDHEMYRLDDLEKVHVQPEA